MAILLIALLLVVLSLQGAQLIEMSSGTDTFVEKTSKLYQDFDHLYLKLFSTQSIVVMVEGKDITNPDLLKALDRSHMSAQGIPGVIEVISPSTVIKEANSKMTGNSEIPDDETIIKDIVASYMPSALMPDNTHAFMSVVIEGSATDQTQQEILKETEASVAFAEFPPDYSIIITGDPAFNIALNDEMNSSMGPLLGISAILMMVVLYMVFGHVRWRLLPLPIVLLGIIFTFGAMGFLEIPMTMVSMAAFPVLIGLGIDYAIQFHNRIEEELGKGEDAAEAVVETIKHIGPAVLIALIITALGFVSLFTSPVPMIQDFGKLLLIGIVMCFMSSLFVGVTVIYYLHRADTKKKLKNANNSRKNYHSVSTTQPDMLDRILGRITAFTLKYPWLILIVASLTCLGGMYVDTMVPLQTDVQTFVPQDMPALLDLKLLGSILGGSEELNLIIKTDNNADPALLQWVDDFSKHEVEGRSHIYGSSSIVSIVKEMNGGEIPGTAEEVKHIYAQMPDIQKQQYIHDGNIMVLNLNIGNAMNDLGLEGIADLSNTVKEDLKWLAPPPGDTVTITGGSVVFFEVIGALTSGRMLMTMLGIVFVFIGLLAIYRDYLKAFTPVITMLIVVGWSGGIMYYTGLEYTPMTATLGALILGVGSEYAILMMERYFEEKDKGASPEEAMHEASVKMGKAIVSSGLTTVFGFAALIASPFSMTSNFGYITVIDVTLALFATFVVFPPVLVLLDKHREERILKKKMKSMNDNHSRVMEVSST
ncbi:hydrophobe/amphiphile efflux-3 family protein [Methanomethylovorans hollandica DSM 15978]|uniref:Hydrophobe/amphiphile efflux-3 family protein n=1 Tax=Methanomethylovorans hollandica (strain DSM 15978 / NBRC 107637 / DMS1) TaxID=867904 RepID=L0KV19_METHD|nr:hydrophobe/amphiphile efflux-3 family protein [Methanomethylovorans hollandica DSM 15978]